jgi:hypothetical protein
MRMKRLTFRIAVAFLTFIIGVALATFLLDQQPPSSLDRIDVTAQSQSANQPQPTQSLVSPDNESDPLEAAFIKGDKLSYAGYDVERSFDAATRESSATIKKNGKTLAIHRNGGLGEASTKIGLFSFLGGGTQQLVIMQYTGGAHCCWIYKIYDLYPKLRLLFDGEKYGIDSIGYELDPKDIDGDGKYEFTQAVMTFDYFHMSHASSVFPSAIFSYDEKMRIYLPANHRFSSYLLKGLEKDLKRVEEERVKIDPHNLITSESYLSAVLQVMLKRIYAGQEAAGWEFFNREYNLNNKDEIKVDIRKAL